MNTLIYYEVIQKRNLSEKVIKTIYHKSMQAILLSVPHSYIFSRLSTICLLLLCLFTVCRIGICKIYKYKSIFILIRCYLILQNFAKLKLIGCLSLHFFYAERKPYHKSCYLAIIHFSCVAKIPFETLSRNTFKNTQKNIR